MQKIIECYTIVDSRRPVYGKMEYRSLEDAKQALEQGHKTNSHLKLIKECAWL